MTLSNAARLATNLRTARRSAGISQGEAADKVRKTRQTIINWENPAMAGAEPSTTELDVLAQMYGLTAQDLRFGTLREPQRAVVETTTPPVQEGVQFDRHNQEEIKAAGEQAAKDRAARARRKKRKAGGDR